MDRISFKTLLLLETIIYTDEILEDIIDQVYTKTLIDFSTVNAITEYTSTLTFLYVNGIQLTARISFEEASKYFILSRTI